MALTSPAPRYRPDPGWKPGGTQQTHRLPQMNPNCLCTLRCYPSDDAQFEADAQATLTESRYLASRKQGLLELMRQRMASLYPDVAIQPRNPLAAGGDTSELWYCYRDGGVMTRSAE